MVFNSTLYAVSVFKDASERSEYLKKCFGLYKYWKFSIYEQQKVFEIHFLAN